MSVLIVGASGLVGTAAIDTFAAAGWDVLAASRRKPETFRQQPYIHIALDLNDASTCRDVATRFPGITHVVYSAVFELPGLVKGWKDPQQMQTNLSMLRNIVEPVAAAGQLRHVTLLQGTKAYGVHHHAIRIPARESEDRDPHDNFYWLQEDFVREHSERHGYAWTIFRPPLVVGPNYGVAMNLPPVIGVYAALCAREGRPFAYPGGASYVTEAVDTRIIASAALWAAANDVAWGEHFNITNGEVFEWRDMWPALARTLGVEAGSDEPRRISEFLTARAAMWDEITAEHRLRPLSLTQVVGQSHYYADFQFVHRALKPPPPALMSTIKLREAGFHDMCNTQDSFTHWLQVLMDRDVIPSPG